jgi:hypothetical protein
MVAPNPVQDEMTVTTYNENSEVSKLGANENVHMQLLDFNTNQLVKQWVVKNDKKQHKIFVTDLKRGKYVLQVIKGRYRKSTQVILK